MQQNENHNNGWSSLDDDLFDKNREYYEQCFTTKDWKPTSPNKVNHCVICNAPGTIEVKSKARAHHLCETCSPLKPHLENALAKGISLIGSKENRILAVLGDVAKGLKSQNPSEMADILTYRNIPSPLGGKWTITEAKFLLDFHGFLDPTDMVAKKMHRRLLMMEIEPLQHMEPDRISSMLNETGFSAENGKPITMQYVEKLLSEIRSCGVVKDE